jgi:hypothetical protein
VVQQETIVEPFFVKVQLEDLLFHSMLNGNSRSQNLCVETLKGKDKQQWRWPLGAQYFQEHSCE